MQWQDIAGHSGIKTILKNMVVSDRIPHALLFKGPAGIGKMCAARVLAAALLCQASGEGNPCGSCFHCSKITQGGHPDLTVVESEGTSIKIDQIRQLSHEVALTSYHGGRRVFIIDNAEQLTTEAANSLLKTLEEPPAATVIILVTSSIYRLLPTLISRCQVIAFQPLAEDLLADWLTKQGSELSKARVAARLGGGRVGVALGLLAKGGLDLRDQAATLIESLGTTSWEKAWTSAGLLEKMGPDDQQALLQYMKGIFRDLWVLIIGADQLVLNQDIVGRLGVMTVQWNEAMIKKAMDDVNNASRALAANANRRLTCEALVIKLMNAAKEEIKVADSCGNTI